MVAVFWSCNRLEESRKREIKNIILIVGNKKTLADFENNRNFENLSKSNHYQVIAAPVSEEQTQPVFANFSAVAIGKNCFENSVGLDSAGVAHPNLIELASVNGMSTGLITSGSLVEPIPASFIAHLNNKNQYESVALEFLDSPVDFITGGGLPYFNNRNDGINLLTQLENKGYLVYNEINKVSKSGKTAVLFDENNTEIQKHLLQKSTVLALQTLSENQTGFFLVIDGTSVLPQSVYAGNKVKKQESDFSHAIETAFDFASQNSETLVVVTSGCFTTNSESPYSVASQPSESIAIYTYGENSAVFNGISESTGIFDKIVNHLNLDMADSVELTNN